MFAKYRCQASGGIDAIAMHMQACVNDVGRRNGANLASVKGNNVFRNFDASGRGVGLVGGQATEGKRESGSA